MLTSEEQAYLDKHKMKRLTFDGVNDLYQHFVYGAHTIADCIYIDGVNAKAAERRNQEQQSIVNRAGHLYQYEASWELCMRHERCIDQHGFGIFGD